jgi:ABC-2 type transport system ATP-binding protein
MIEIDNLSKNFGDLTAVDSISMNINEGEVFGFLGPNGAGKTTTVRMLCTLISKTSGNARIAGYDIGNKDDSLKIRKIIGLVPDNVGLSEHMSAYDNLDFFARVYDLSKTERKEKIQYFLEMLGLWDKRYVSVATFSKGMKQKLAIARALLHDPQVLFLKKQKKTIFLNTHNLDEAQRICDRIGILKTRLVSIGTPSELEDAVRGRRTVIELEQVTDNVLKSVQKLSLANLELEGNTITFDTIDSGSKNWPIVEAIVHAGGHVNIVKVLGSTLEDVYLKMVGGNQ